VVVPLPRFVEKWSALLTDGTTTVALCDGSTMGRFVDAFVPVPAPMPVRWADKAQLQDFGK
jgi:hypothetical protein